MPSSSHGSWLVAVVLQLGCMDISSNLLLLLLHRFIFLLGQ
jgi:hypothetical protein